MKRKFAVFDIDGTLFRSGLYREVVFELMKDSVISADIIERTEEKLREWRHRTHSRAFEEFELALTSGLDSQLKSIKTSDYDKAAQRVIEAQADNVYVFTRDLLKRLKNEGYFTIAISGSQLELVEPFAKKYGFDDWTGQWWERGDEYFTGRITKTHTGKDVLLQAFIDKHGLTLEDSWAIGDSNGDVGMLRMVEHPVVFNPTHELMKTAMEDNWDIVVERKNVIYELEKHGETYLLARTRTF